MYVYGFDSPEAYAIEKDGHLYYAFYAPASPSTAKNKRPAPQPWSGEIELRGLDATSYHVINYVDQNDLGTVAGPVAKLKVDFADHLLLEATPAAQKP